uniref:PPM-type phosphatase domain-containing protein n=1 Tax=Odontella aurita TaxID=265563 RepID=A0A7S4N8C8_9STRA|mmetsp:Transcript_51839/g.155579  ORF Transcript_51839/g.155579 Transcript_51839/m.155579 type:complete len:398 (+) Transcript_51839:150-1343(+)
MGCASSSEAATPVAPPQGVPVKKHHAKSVTAGTEAMALTTHTISNEPAVEPETNMTVKLGTVQYRIAAKSQKGKDPEVPTKPNQDCFSMNAVGEGGDSYFFGVYDGHGPTGEQCSQLVQQHLHKLVTRNMAKHTDDVGLPLHKAHIEVNEILRSSSVNDALSGTTAISVLLHDSNKITVSNVGDSRAVLGSTLPGTLQAAPLSKDQTPYRKDEAARCQSRGARILSFGQIRPDPDDDPEVEDPPRVWHPELNMPGTAFTRSIGDSVAEPLGVCAEPECLTVPLTEHENLILLASDGVFDVMTNQQVAELAYMHKDDPEKACEAIIKKSYEEWLINDDCVGDEEHANYDDMTVLVIFVDHPNSTKEVSTTSTEHPRPHKRVRQKTLRNMEEMSEFTGQ